MKNFLDQLNNEQRQAVLATEGPMMVIAGAGSGKTRVLTYKVAYLINQGVDAFSILALTFTNKAAREMKERIIQLVGTSQGANVWMGTFHAIFSRILRVESDKLGFTSNFTIYDTDDSKSLIRSIVKELNLDSKVYAPSVMLGRISAVKSSLISASEYNMNQEYLSQDQQAGRGMFGLIFSTYQNRLKKSNAMDFDDLLFFTNVLLRDFPDVLIKYQRKFKYILVDEYQDTNHAQYIIIKRLSAMHRNICVVGDDAQSIYGFRGARIENILNFKNDYPEYQIFKLEQNYRSTQNIVKAANQIIANNKDQIFKKIWTQNEEGNKIRLLKAVTENEESLLVAQSIFETKVNLHIPNSEFAVLYRTNAQSRSIEEALRRMNIPYRIFGGLSFYKRKEIKDLTAYFRLTVNPYDEEALERIINYPTRGIGQTTIEKIQVAAHQQNCPIWDIVANIENFNLGLHQGIRKKIDDFATMIKSFQALLTKKNAYELARHIAVASGIVRELREDQTPEGISRMENIDELINATRDFCEKENPEVSLLSDEQLSNDDFRSLDLFLRDIALLTDADNDSEQSNDYVSLMTVHSAKGLEFPHVYLIGVEENLFPNIMALNSREDLEEERRLFYVAVTRAEKQLTISFALSRFNWGQMHYTEPSRFIDEIDPDCFELPFRKAEPATTDNFSETPTPKPAFERKKIVTENMVPLLKAEKNTVQHNGNDAFTTDVCVGMDVLHQKFGIGKVMEVEGDGPNKKATVFFTGIGNKQLLLRFAKLIIINAETNN